MNSQQIADELEKLLRQLSALHDAYYANFNSFVEDAARTIDSLRNIEPMTKPMTPNVLRLRWPTDERRITQRFGARPLVYSKFKVGGVPLPGHDGTDIACADGGNVYACADGVVKLVTAQWRRLANGRAEDHPYGYHIRITHKVGSETYETIYAHLQDMSAKVHEGERVTAGQLIALGDSTGNSSGAHLHLTLKWIGATARGHQSRLPSGVAVVYPGDLVNPEAYGVDWPG